MFDCGGVRIGFEICEDAWVAHRPGGDLARHGVDVILNPSASHFAFDKHEIRKRLVLDGSRAFSVGYVYANLLGNEAGRAIYDGDAMVASCGKLLAVGSRFSFRDFAVTSAIVDIDEIRMQRSRISSFRPDAHVETKTQVTVDFVWPTAAQQDDVSAPTGWEDGSFQKEEEFTRAVALGLFDYMRKSQSRGFVVSLSGGADSAAVTVLCSLAIRLALAELGLELFRNKLAHVPDIQELENVADIMRPMLTCVYQSTRNSGEVTRNAARAVSEATHAQFLEMDIDGLVSDYVDLVSHSIQRELSWSTDDIALQNIQARARGPGIWMLANIRGALLLSTSNRSEAAVGYATMDGDTCGGLSPIAGIDKAFLRHWLRWMETHAPEGVAALSPLKLVNEQQPTAELRPQDSNQTDEQDLMPYDLLDAIERSAIRDKHPPLEVYDQMLEQFPQYESHLAGWVERFFLLWCRNQWKRERYAPSFHLDDENLDPKTWCRFPILSGGYARELRELRARLSDA